MADTALIALHLEGVLQSWSEDAKWDYRYSASFPSKSAIVGMMGAALGFARGSEALDRLCDEICIAVRADRAGTKLIDYQTVTGNPLMSAEGKKRSGGNTIITPREYLQDAAFLVLVQTTDEWQDKLEQAFAHPKWSVCLGRKSCVPSRPVWGGIHTQYRDLIDAVKRFPTCLRAEYPLCYEIEQAQDTPSYWRPDRLLKSKNRAFGTRQVWLGTIEEAENVFNQD